MHAAPDEPLLSFEEVAARLGLSRYRLSRCIAEGQFPRGRYRDGNRLLWPASDCTRFLGRGLAARVRPVVPLTAEAR